MGAKIERSQISLPSSLLALVSSEQALNWGLYGGEDFELVLCLPLDLAEKLVKRLGNGAAIIGTIIAEPRVILIDSQGKYPEQELSLTKGFQHFK